MFKISLHRKQKQQPENTRLYCKCNETPMDVFIDVLVNKNFNRLIREGKPTEKEIESAWNKLWFEYADLTGSPEYRQLFGLIKEVSFLEGKLVAIRTALNCLQSIQDFSCISILNNYGYKYQFDRSKPDEFNKDIARTFEKSKTIELLINSTRSKIDEINSKSQKQEITEGYFDECMAVLSKYMGFRINRKVITVSEFIRMKKMLELETERINSRTHGK